RLCVIKNVVAASVGGMLTYSVYLGLLQMQLILHYDETYREVKYGNLGLEDIDNKMLMGINVTPIVALLYTPVLIRFLGTKWMMFLASGIYALFVSTNYWERYYTLVPSAVAIGVAIVPLWASLGNYITRLNQSKTEPGHCDPCPCCHEQQKPVFFIIMHRQLIKYNKMPRRLGAVTVPVLVTATTRPRTPRNVLCQAPVSSPGSDGVGIISGLNKTVLSRLPRSVNLIEVESALMGVAFIAMITFLALCGSAYRPTEEIDLRSIGWGNIFQLPFKHMRDYRLRLLCPFFIYSGFEVLFAITGLTL
uniref:Unc-93 homolog B1, TLR signaling regulator n=1 Tax=Lepisosteus oculatus TaxID=7918 RepID=W5MMJ0_LEPOC